jgi:hypothetical protein
MSEIDALVHFRTLLSRGAPPVNRPWANLAFSLLAFAGALTIAIASGVKGRWAVAIVFALLALGFLVRAAEFPRRGGRG